MHLKLGLFLLLTLASPHLRANSETWPKNEWPQLKIEDNISYNELCLYDKRCKLLKIRDSEEIKVPHSLLLKLFWLQRESVAAIAKKYGIHPLIPIAAIISEHSFNVGIEDIIQDNFRSIGLDINGRLLALKDVSYGYGQLKNEASENAERIVARIENRNPKNLKYIEERTSSIQGAYEYIAALMLYYTELYAEAQIDISHNPAILTTLYNIGKAEERLARTLSENRTPKSNYLGWFVLHNWSLFETIYNSNSFNLEYIADSQQSLQESENDGFVGDVVKLFSNDNTVPTLTTNVEVLLKDNPPQCSISRENFTSNQIENKEIEYLNSIRNSQTHPYMGLGSFDIHSKKFDCLGKLWSLVRFSESGKMGWLNLESNKQTIEMIYRSRECEDGSRVEPQCIDKIKGLLDSPDDFLRYDAKNHISYIRLGHNSLFETKDIRLNNYYFNNWHNYCRHPHKVKKLQGNYNTLVALKDKTKTIDPSYNDLTLRWILHHNNKRKEKIATNSFFNDSYFLTEADKQRLTPIVNQAIKRLERELGAKEISSPLIYTPMSQSVYASNYHEPWLESIFLYKFLPWAYKYRQYCFYLNHPCSISIPLDKLIKIGKDIIQHGFLSDFVMEAVLVRDYKMSSWIFPHKPKNKYDPVPKTYLEMMEILEPQLSRSETLPAEFRKIIMKVSEYYLSIKETPFNQLKVVLRDSFSLKTISLDNKIEELDTIISYINGELPSSTFSSNCSINIFHKKTYIKKIPCKFFHVLQWDHKKLKGFLNDAVSDIIESYSYFIKIITAQVTRNKFPINEIVVTPYYSSDIETVKNLLMSCNYNFNKTFDTLKRLSESSCIDALFVPEEKILNNKLREEEINFNTYPFRENDARMAIKFKTSCKED